MSNLPKTIHDLVVTDHSETYNSRGVDPYGTGGTRPPNIWTGGHYRECPPNISGVISATFYPCNIFFSRVISATFYPRNIFLIS